MITFKIDQVTPRAPEQSFNQRWTDMVLSKLKAEAHKFSGNLPGIHAPNDNSFVKTVYDAYAHHSPLCLGPDEVWLAVLQGVAKHIELNADEVRHAIVPYDGKQKLEVRRDSFVKGSPDNDWEGAFAEFSDLIGEVLGRKRDLFDPSFSTTTPTTKAAIQVQMMAALAPYFDYSMMTCCGIPELTLMGSVEDWEGLHQRVTAFREFYPSWAADPLESLTAQFVQSAKGTPDISFWSNFFKTQGGSGGTPVNGLINSLFPYIKGKPNKAIVNGTMLGGARQGNDLGDFPSSVATAPMLWNYHGAEIQMSLSSGLWGTYVEEGISTTLPAYRPSVGWVVHEGTVQNARS